MSITRRIIDLAKANLNAILEKAAETADPRRRLATIPDAELEAELARRRAARLAEQRVVDAKARVDAKGSAEDGGARGASAGAGAKMPADRAARERAAREREARVRAAREARERAERERTQRAQSHAGPRPGSGARAGTGPGTGSAPPPRRPGAARGRDPDLARYYERLELPYGSDFEAVKAAYRKLMRRYHPDLHGGKSPEKLRAATEVAQALTQAYNELEKVLLGGPNRRV
jgi:hypothetical protein